jgi:nicotinate-nucleotide pyrophosphorylase (carboxylating)
MEPVPRHLLARVVADTLREDLGPGDVTTEAVIDGELSARAEIRARSEMVLAGLDAAILCFRTLDPEVEAVPAARDGEVIPREGIVLRLSGRARALLSGERSALNFLGRLSGIATLTNRYVEAARPHTVAITDTRKTTPTLRALEKYAVAMGNGTNHRFGLWDAILIKDNHVDLAGGVPAAVTRAREASPASLPVEVEVRSLDELQEALEAGADAVLLDNFSLESLESAVRMARGRALLEVSGGVRLDSIGTIAAMGVDRISIGALTHSATAADLTMRMKTWTT